MVAKQDSIDAALGLGELFKLSNGDTLPVAPCGLGDLRDAVTLYANTLEKYFLQIIFLPENEEVKNQLDDLLLMASGAKYEPTQQNERDQALKVIYAKFTDVGDFGSEVTRYIKRFLRLIPRDTGTAETQTEAQAQG